MKKIRNLASSVVTLIAALIPVFKSCPPCPVCMPKYAAIFAFFGLELSDYSHYLIPIMLVSMLISLTSMFYQIRHRKLKYYTFFTAFLSCLSLIISKFVFDHAMSSYICMSALLISMICHHKYIGKHSNNKTCCDFAKCTNNESDNSLLNNNIPS